MSKTKITLETLARMVQNGFAESATKHELEVLRLEMRQGFSELKDSFKKSVRLTAGQIAELKI